MVMDCFIKKHWFISGNASTLGPNIYAPSSSSNNALAYVFPVPVTIDSYQVSFANAPMAIWLLGANNEKLSVISPVNGSVKTSITPVSNVRSVYFVNTTTASNLMMPYEFEVYGIQEIPDPEKFVINGLKAVPTSGTSITLSWDAVQSVNLKRYQIYRDNQLLGNVTATSYSVSSLVPGQTYNFKVAPVDVNDKVYTSGAMDYTVPVPDTTPPQVPVGVKITPDRYTASVTADPVPDSDLAGYHVFLDGNRVTSQPVQLPYTVQGLKLDTEYEVEVASIDLSGNISARSSKASFRTLTLESEPGAVSVTASPFNGGALLSWSPVATAREYKVYNSDGTFIMKTTQTSAKITRLKNGQVHAFYVIASNAIGDSPRSNVVEVKPESSLAPDVSLGYKLKDVADGTSSWFSSFWLLLAFTISIPLSFYVSNRVKGLFES